jgi:hypothetical protein
MPHTISDPVVYKQPEWKPHVDAIMKAGNVKPVRGITPEGLPPGGYWEYRRRSNYGRIYIIYSVPVPGGKKNQRTSHVIGSVNPDYAQDAVIWKPEPYCKKRFDFSNGPVVVHYDAQALPTEIVYL